MCLHTFGSFVIIVQEHSLESFVLNILWLGVCFFQEELVQLMAYTALNAMFTYYR